MGRKICIAIPTGKRKMEALADVIEDLAVHGYNMTDIMVAMKEMGIDGYDIKDAFALHAKRHMRRSGVFLAGRRR